MLRPALYLTLCSTRNWFRVQYGRLRSPRYLLAIVLGSAYLWLIFFRRRGGGHSAFELSGPMVERLGAMRVTAVPQGVARKQSVSRRSGFIGASLQAIDTAEIILDFNIHRTYATSGFLILRMPFSRPLGEKTTYKKK